MKGSHALESEAEHIPRLQQCNSEVRLLDPAVQGDFSDKAFRKKE
jgi:hypothetical protein